MIPPSRYNGSDSGLFPNDVPPNDPSWSRLKDKSFDGVAPASDFPHPTAPLQVTLALMTKLSSCDEAAETPEDFATTFLRHIQQSAQQNRAQRSRRHDNAAKASAWSASLLGHLRLYLATPSFDGLEPVRATPTPTFYFIISNFSLGRLRGKRVPEVSSDLIFIFRVRSAPSC